MIRRGWRAFQNPNINIRTSGVQLVFAMLVAPSLAYPKAAMTPGKAAAMLLSDAPMERQAAAEYISKNSKKMIAPLINVLLEAEGQSKKNLAMNALLQIFLYSRERPGGFLDPLLRDEAPGNAYFVDKIIREYWQEPRALKWLERRASAAKGDASRADHLDSLAYSLDGDTSGAQFFIDQYESEDRPYVKARLAGHLGGFGDPRGLDYCIEILSAPPTRKNLPEQIGAARCLGKAGTPAQIPRLLEVSKDAAFSIARSVATESILEIRLKAARDKGDELAFLLSKLKEEGSASWSMDRLRHLWVRGDDRVKDRLLEVQKGTDLNAAHFAADFLKKTSGKEAEP